MVVYPVWPLHALSVQAAQRQGCYPWGLHQASFPNPPPHPAEKSAPCPRTISFLSCCRFSSRQSPDHSKDEVPEPVLNQLFLEITPHQELYFLTQMISFYFRASSLAFLNATVRIDAVLDQRTAVDSCLQGDFTSLSNQAGPS